MYLAECGQQLGRHPSKKEAPNPLWTFVLKSFPGLGRFAIGIRLYFVHPRFPSPKFEESQVKKGIFDSMFDSLRTGA